MGFYFESYISEFLIVFAVLLCYVYYYLNSNFDYWKKRGVPYIKPHRLFGNSKESVLGRKTLGVVFQEFYNSEELKNEPIGGIFLLRNPVLIIRDLELIKDIMIKDFKHFSDRGLQVDEKRDPLGAHLFNLGGWRWRALRTKLTPTFTSGKMKTMYSTMLECSVGLDKLFGQFAANGDVIDIKDQLAKFTTDIIGTCAFGLQFNSIENDKSEFREMGRRIFKSQRSSQLKRLIISASPFLANFLGLTFVDQVVNNFFLNVVKETVDYREKANVTRNDMLQLLIDIKNQGQIVDEEDKYLTNDKVATDEAGHQVLELSDSLLAAQVFVFFIAGFETSSTTMSFVSYELALNPEIQDRLAKEIQEVSKRYDDKMTYECIQEMKYLDMVISETLRKYPPVPVLFRKVTKPMYHERTRTKFEAGVRMFIPTFAIQQDPNYFPDPKKFDPERFSPENKANIHPMAYLPFGDGPRNCIGERFGLLQTKLGLATVLRKYKLEVCDKTLIPLQLDPFSFILSCTGGIWLKVSPRE